MDLDHASEIARRRLNQNGLIDWVFKLNQNKRRLGLCKQYLKQIELSAPYVLRNEIDHVTDTILHEIAHALVGAEHGHDAVWKQKCMQLGCKPKACEMNVDMPSGDWRAQCPSCREVFTRHRRPVSLKGMYCIACGPESGRLSFSNTKVSYQRRVEKASNNEHVQLMLKIFD